MQAPPNNLALPLWFVCYAGVTGLLYLFLPRLLGQPYLMPWDYWWVFLLITPPLVGGLLGWQVQRGKYTKFGVLLFVLAAILLGIFYGWFSYELSGAV